LAAYDRSARALVRRKTLHTAIFEIRFTTSERTGGSQFLKFEKTDHCHNCLTDRLAELQTVTTPLGPAPPDTALAGGFFALLSPKPVGDDSDRIELADVMPRQFPLN